MNRTLIMSMSILLGITFCSTGIGSTVTVEVTGVVDSVFVWDGFELDGSVDVGTMMTGLFVYDTEASKRIGGGYYAISIEMNIGNYYFSVLEGQDSIFSVGADNYYSIYTYNAEFDDFIYDYGVAKSYQDLSWFVTDMTIADLRTSNDDYFSGINTLPVWFPDITGFDLINKFSLVFYEEVEWFPDDTYTGGGFAIRGELTSINIIPEPATVLLIGLGAIGLLRKNRRGW